ncbi:hypothetical protein Fmac_001713 [Flemingia macrophylla]|uniref:Transmembrane protein n=1 Tax=Flemingia macrophylla TaxID=520843 RepID=A0ABD1NHW2_9FABA
MPPPLVVFSVVSLRPSWYVFRFHWSSSWHFLSLFSHAQLFYGGYGLLGLRLRRLMRKRWTWLGIRFVGDRVGLFQRGRIVKGKRKPPIVKRLERKTVKRKRILATLKVLGTVLEQLSEEIPD